MRGIARDVHGLNKLMMANGTPSSLCWLASNLDVMGTETDWNPGGQWRPMGDEELLYRRALCRGKPYCFLMNTGFTRLPHERVDDKPRITRCHLPHRRRVLFLVTAHRPHGRQATRDRVHAVGNTPAERQVGKGSHGRY